MAKKKKRWTEDESSSSSSSSTDDLLTEETRCRRSRSQAQRNAKKKKSEVISILTELKEEMRKQSKKLTESKDDTCEIRKQLEKLTESYNDQSKKLEKLTKSHNDLCKQLEFHTKGTSGDDSAASRSQSNQVQQPRYKLKFTSEVTEKIEKGQSIDITVALVEYNNEDRTVEDEPLASATVELVVINAEFNQHDNQYNWSREDFESNIKKAQQPNSAAGGVDQSVKSIVSNGRFNLVHGVKCHSGSKIFSNSSNKKVRLGVMVVSPTEERVLEGLSNPFFVRGHDRPNRQCKLLNSWSNRQGIYDGYQERNCSMPNMQQPSLPNSIQAIDEPLPSDNFMALNDVESNFWGAPGTEFNMNQTALPVHLVLDRPNVELRKRRWDFLEQLMPLYSCQRKLNKSVSPTMRLMSEQTRRRGGVLIEPLEPDDSDERRPLKRMMHSKYHLRFVNKVCETYYTREKIKAYDGNLLKVALFDENNTRITSGPLSSACVEVVALHGDFNVDGQDYWTSDEFSRGIVCPQPGKEASALGGDLILVLDGGEACLADAFFQVTSFVAITRKFKMGVKMLASGRQDERIQEGISEAFWVKDHPLGGFFAGGMDGAAASGALSCGAVAAAADPGRTMLSFAGPATDWSRSAGGGTEACSVDGCRSDLSRCREYHRRHRVCEAHSKTLVVVVGGQEQRFCQHCSRFHRLPEFDGGRKSCRRRLDGHNRRRRKPQHGLANLGGFFPYHQVNQFEIYPRTIPTAHQDSEAMSLVNPQQRFPISFSRTPKPALSCIASTSQQVAATAVTTAFGSCGDHHVFVPDAALEDPS